MSISGDNIMSIRRSNRMAVLYHVHEHGAVSRKMLAETLDLTAAAITKIVGGLMDDGLLVEGSTLRSKPGAGRSQVLMEINPKAFCGLGVFLSIGQAILSGVWLDGTLAFSECVDLPDDMNTEEIVDLLADRLMQLADENSLSSDRITGIGLAVRGMVNLSDRIVRNSFGMLPDLNVPLAEMFEKRTGLPTVINNNVRALFSAQMFLSRDRQELSQMFLRCEYGIGASLSIDHQIWNGGNGLCSEIGHIPVIRRGGKPCACGKCGCLETVASPEAIRKEAIAICSPSRTPLLWKKRQSSDRELTLNDVLECASQGDAGTARIVETAVRLLGAALKNVIYIVDPQKIVLSGRLFENKYFVQRLMAEMAEGVDSDHSGVLIEKSPYNNQLDPIAAGILSIESFFSNGGMCLDL